MRYEHNFYMTSDSFLDIEFLFVETSLNNWKGYILSEINYKQVSDTRSDSIVDIHRLSEKDEIIKRKIQGFIQNNQRPYNNSTIYYICWSKPITSLEDMRAVARSWSEITSYYIQHGGSFQNIQSELISQGVIN